MVARNVRRKQGDWFVIDHYAYKGETVYNSNAQLNLPNGTILKIIKFYHYNDVFLNKGNFNLSVTSEDSSNGTKQITTLLTYDTSDIVEFEKISDSCFTIFGEINNLNNNLYKVK